MIVMRAKWLAVLIISVLAVSVWLAGRQAGFTSAAAQGGAVSASGNTQLYLVDQRSGRALQPLDPATLANLPAGQSIALGNVKRWNIHPRLLVSADGSTLAAITPDLNGDTNLTARDITVRIFDLPSGGRRASFHPPVTLQIDSIGMSPDGRQIFGLRDGVDGQSLGWYVLNTSNGRTLERMPFTHACCGPWLYDASSRHLFVLDTGDGEQSKPVPARIVEYDVAARRKVGTAVLPHVLVGAWPLNKSTNGEPVMGMWSPGLALSPDGGQLAVLAANSDILNLVDARTMHVAETRIAAGSEGVGTRLLGWLGLTPAQASAKEIQGVLLDAAFSADGHSLFVTGTRGGFDAKGAFAWHSLGLRIVDAASGKLRSESLENQQVTWVRDTPDGIYVLTTGSSSPEELSCPCTLHRLDPSTFQVTSERHFDRYPDLVVARR